jgi:hypothetical protein
VLRCFFPRPTALTANMLPVRNVSHITSCEKRSSRVVARFQNEQRARSRRFPSQTEAESGIQYSIFA